MRFLRRALASLFLVGTLIVAEPSFEENLQPRAIHPTLDINVYIDGEFTPRERTSIINGIMLWERATNGMITWSVHPWLGEDLKSGVNDSGVEERMVIFRRTYASEQWVADWDKSHERSKLVLYGLTVPVDRGSAIVYLIESRLSDEHAETFIAAHEFGHVMGIQHVDDPGSVMNSVYSRKIVGITRYDISAFCYAMSKSSVCVARGRIVRD